MYYLVVAAESWSRAVARLRINGGRDDGDRIVRVTPYADLHEAGEVS